MMLTILVFIASGNLAPGTDRKRPRRVSIREIEHRERAAPQHETVLVVERDIAPHRRAVRPHSLTAVVDTTGQSSDRTGHIDRFKDTRMP